MATIRALAVILAGLAASVAPAAADGTFRCGSKLLVLGMTQGQVLEQCGEPASKVEEVHDVRSGPHVVGKTTVSHWTYSSYSATRVLVFDADKLVRIE
jgi:hypothetical protein